KVKADNVTSVGLQQLACDQSNQPEPHYDYRFTQSRIGKTDSLKTDSTNNSKCGFVIGHVIWDFYHKIGKYRNILCMGTVGSNPVAYLKVLNTFSNSNHPSHITIP